MHKSYYIAFSVLVALLLGGCAANKETQVETAPVLDVEHFKKHLILEDDANEGIATFSTINGFKENKGRLVTDWGDSFVRANVDKKTGVATFLVYNQIYYKDHDWKRYHQVDYEVPGGRKSTEVTIISQDVDCKGSGYSGCFYSEQVTFAIGQQLLDPIVETYVPGTRSVWRYKITPKSGKDYRSGLWVAEIVAIVEAVAEYKKSMGLKN